MSFPVQVIVWTDERVATLKVMWGEGYSAAKIAKAVGEGCTRSCVCGKVHRLKLPQRAKRGRHAPKPAKSVVKASVPPSPSFANVLATQLAMVTEAGHPVTLEDVTDQTCRWPLGDPVMPDFRFCGCKPMIGRPYCAVHAELGRAKAQLAVKVGADGEPTTQYRGRQRLGQTALWR